MEHKNSHENHTPTYTTNILVFFVLIVLTGLTVSASGLELGRFKIPLALLIAVTKGTLVAAFFMHLKFEASYFRGFIYFALFFLIVSIILTFVDVAYRI